MKGKLLVSMLVACLPWLAMAQSNDDLYFIPKKEKKVEKKEKVGMVPRKVMNETVNELPAGTTFVVKDVKGNVRNVDEYNRRYSSRDNTFSYQNDTLLVTEKPYDERGEWVNEFQGTDSDYEYAMRLVRFRNPRYAIPVSSPLYWEVVNGAFMSWDWNVYDDGMYAYVFPSYTNSLWWDWRWSNGFYGPGWGFSITPGWGFSFGWSSPWYNSWYSPYWCGGYWGGYWGGHWGGYWGPAWHHHNPYYGGSYYGPRYHYNNRRGELRGQSHGGSYGSADRGSLHSGRRVTSIGDNRGRTGGRVVRSSGSIDNGRSSRVTGTRSRNGSYTRPVQSSDRTNRVYTRPSSTRRSTTIDRNQSGSRRHDSYKYTPSSSSRNNSGATYRSGGGSSRNSGGSYRSGGGGSRSGGSRRR